MSDVVERFLSYVKVNTRSDLESTTAPSTPVQFDLAKLLVAEMKSLGVQDVELDEKCYIYGTIPATTSRKIPTIGLIAHMDTSYEISGEGVKPQIIQSYNGEPIILNAEQNVVLSPAEFPELLKVHWPDPDYIGWHIPCLGADDKAGVAVIMTVAATLLQNPQIEHGKIQNRFHAG